MTNGVSLRRSAPRLVAAAALGGVLFLAPRAAWGQVVSSAELSLGRASHDGSTWLSPSIAVASTGDEHGFAPTRPLWPITLPFSELGATGETGPGPTRWQQVTLRATHGSSWGHGTLTELRADWRLGLAGAGGGAWFSLGASGVTGGDEMLRLPLLGLGGWVRQRAVSVFGQIDQTLGYSPVSKGSLSLVPEYMNPESIWVYREEIVPGEPGDLVAVTRAQLRTRYEIRSLALEAGAGVDVASQRSPRRWAEGSAAVTVLPRVRLFGSYGSPSTPLFLDESPGQPRAAVGLRISPEASDAPPSPQRRDGEIRSWRLAAEGAGRYRFSVRAEGAASVEMMGDITGWQPLALTHWAPSLWEVTLEMAPGVHQVVVRANGGPWGVPPRMTTTESEFAGTVGVLIVE